METTNECNFYDNHKKQQDIAGCNYIEVMTGLITMHYISDLYGDLGGSWHFVVMICNMITVWVRTLNPGLIFIQWQCL